MESLDKKIAKLPPHLQQEIHDFVEFLLQKVAKRSSSNLTMSWAGGLREYRDQYTSLELQKKVLEWRD